jgi:hypothetical protein
MGQMVLGSIGAIIGAYYGGYSGATAGYAIGSAIGAVAFPPKVDGPSVAATLMQRSNYGATLPIGFGSFRVAGNVMWEGGLSSSTSGSGKGSPSVSTTSWYATFAVAICDCSITGPIAGIRRIWMNGQLVYDVSGNASAATISASIAWANQYMVLYKGTATQGEDPTMQAALGVGNVSGYHYTAYVVFVNLPLTQFSNVIPVVNFEITNAPPPVYAVLLMHFDEPDGSTTWVDSSGFNANIVIDAGFPVISTTQSQFGGSSYKGNILGMYPGGPIGLMATNPTPTVYDIWNSDWTVEFWAYFETNFSSSTYLSIGNSLPIGGGPFPSSGGGSHIDFVLDATGQPNVYFQDNTGHNFAGGFSGTIVPASTWTHVAFVRHNNVLMCYVGGVASSITWTLPTTGFSGLTYYAVGGSRCPNAETFVQGYFDELRISVGAVYTVAYPGSFTPPVAELTAGGGGGGLSEITLDVICYALAKAVGIASGNIDVSQINTVPVWGCLIERQAALRDILTSLAPTFWFDMVESDQKLAFRQRTSAPLATITAADMVSAKGGESPLLITRVDDLALPFHVDVGYYNIGADYQVGSQYAERLTTQSTQRTSINAAATMTDQDAVNAAAVILWDAWAGRLQFEFSTGFKWGQVEPTDIVTLENGSQSYLARIVEKNEQAPIIKWKAVGCAPVYNQNVAPGIIVPTSQVVGSAGPTTLMLLDLQPLRDQDGNTAIPQLYVVMCGADVNWAGGVLFKSLDGGATWIQQVTSTLASGVGVTTAALTDWTGGNVFDECSTVTVNILTPGGSLASASELAVLNGANLCLIGNELLQFKNATLLTGTSYRLTGLLRGRIDTEGAMTGHTIGETFVLLSFANGAEANLNIEVEGLSDIGAAREYKAVTLNQPLASATMQVLTSKGQNLVCFHPWGLLAVNSPGTNDILLSWWRRNRITWQWLNSVDVPMSEATEAYVVSIFNGPSVVRTFSVAGTGIDTAKVTYTEAQQITDFGVAQTGLTWGVQQISAITGAGSMAKITSPIEAVGLARTLTASVSSTATLTAHKIIPVGLSASVSTTASV